MDENNAVQAPVSSEDKKAVARRRTFFTILALDAILVILIAVSIVSIFTGGSKEPATSEPESSLSVNND